MAWTKEEIQKRRLEGRVTLEQLDVAKKNLNAALLALDKASKTNNTLKADVAIDKSIKELKAAIRYIDDAAYDMTLEANFYNRSKSKGPGRPKGSTNKKPRKPRTRKNDKEAK